MVVGETWEGWTLPLELIERSPYRDDIELVNRYVTDQEAAGYFQRADVVALPYLRSSASGPLAIAQAYGLPVVVTAVGGLVEAAADYTGAVSGPAWQPDDLARGLLAAADLRGRHAFGASHLAGCGAVVCGYLRRCRAVRADTSRGADMKPAVVTTSWDDGHKRDIKLARMLKEHGLKATFYVAPENQEFAKHDLLSLPEVADISKDFEIGAHSMTHRRLPTISESESAGK